MVPVKLRALTQPVSRSSLAHRLSDEAGQPHDQIGETLVVGDRADNDVDCPSSVAVRRHPVGEVLASSPVPDFVNVAARLHVARGVGLYEPSHQAAAERSGC